MEIVSLKVSFGGGYLIYEVGCTLFDDIYIGNTQQTFKKRINFHFSNIHYIL